MRRFIKNILKVLIIFLPFVIFSLYCKFGLIRFCNDVIPHCIWNKNLKEQNFEVCIIGDSIANAAYLPNVLGTNTINLALSSSTPIEMYYIFSNYLKKNSTPKVCYISFMDYHFVKETGLYNKYFYSHILSFKQQIEILKMAKKFNEKSMIKYKDFINTYFYTPQIYLPSLIANSPYRFSSNKYNMHRNDIHFGSHVSWRNLENWNMEPYTKNDFEVKPMFDFYYRKLIELCVQNGIQVRLVTLPINIPVEYTEKYKNEVFTYYENLKKDFPSITFDWICDGFDQTHFFDTEHMNINGAVHFSSIIKEMYPDDFAFNNSIYNHKVIEGLKDYIFIPANEKSKEVLEKILSEL